MIRLLFDRNLKEAEINELKPERKKCAGVR